MDPILFDGKITSFGVLPKRNCLMGVLDYKTFDTLSSRSPVPSKLTVSNPKGKKPQVLDRLTHSLSRPEPSHSPFMTSKLHGPHPALPRSPPLPSPPLNCHLNLLSPLGQVSCCNEDGSGVYIGLVSLTRERVIHTCNSITGFKIQTSSAWQQHHRRLRPYSLAPPRHSHPAPKP